MERKNKQLSELVATIAEREDYLRQLEVNIKAVSDSGEDAIRELQMEVNTWENKKAKLMKDYYLIEQKIRERSL